jgi:hypothetical protein
VILKSVFRVYKTPSEKMNIWDRHLSSFDSEALLGRRGKYSTNTLLQGSDHRVENQKNTLSINHNPKKVKNFISDRFYV